MEISIMFESKTLKLQWFWNKILAVFEKIYFSFLKTKTKNPSQRTTKLYTWKVEKRKRWKITEVTVFADRNQVFSLKISIKIHSEKWGSQKCPLKAGLRPWRKVTNIQVNLCQKLFFSSTKGQLISKQNCRASSKKRT